MGEGGEIQGASDLEETATGEDELREETLPKFSQTREAANRASEERKDGIFSVEGLYATVIHRNCF